MPYLIAILSAGLDEPAAITAMASFCYTDIHQDMAAWSSRDNSFLPTLASPSTCSHSFWHRERRLSPV